MIVNKLQIIIIKSTNVILANHIFYKPQINAYEKTPSMYLYHLMVRVSHNNNKIFTLHLSIIYNS